MKALVKLIICLAQIRLCPTYLPIVSHWTCGTVLAIQRRSMSLRQLSSHHLHLLPSVRRLQTHCQLFTTDDNVHWLTLWQSTIVLAGAEIRRAAVFNSRCSSSVTLFGQNREHWSTRDVIKGLHLLTIQWTTNSSQLVEPKEHVLQTLLELLRGPT